MFCRIRNGTKQRIKIQTEGPRNMCFLPVFFFLGADAIFKSWKKDLQLFFFSSLAFRS